MVRGERGEKGSGGGQMERKGLGIGEGGDHLLTVLNRLDLTKRSNTSPKLGFYRILIPMLTSETPLRDFNCPAFSCCREILKTWTENTKPGKKTGLFF